MITYSQIMKYGTQEFKELTDRAVKSYAEIWKVSEQRAKKSVAKEFNTIYSECFKIKKGLADVETNMALSVLK